MTQKLGTSKDAADKLVKNIRRKTQTYSSEEKIRIVSAGLRGEKKRLGAVATAQRHQTRYRPQHPQGPRTSQGVVSSHSGCILRCLYIGGEASKPLLVGRLCCPA